MDNCWGFLDSTAHPICRPSKDQRQSFSGHKRLHVLKYQALMRANGIICQLDGPFEDNRHDAGKLFNVVFLFVQVTVGIYKLVTTSKSFLKHSKIKFRTVLTCTLRSSRVSEYKLIQVQYS